MEESRTLELTGELTGYLAGTRETIQEKLEEQFKDLKTVEELNELSTAEVRKYLTSCNNVIKEQDGERSSIKKFFESFYIHNDKALIKDIKEYREKLDPLRNLLIEKETEDKTEKYKELISYVNNILDDYNLEGINVDLLIEPKMLLASTTVKSSQEVIVAKLNELDTLMVSMPTLRDYIGHTINVTEIVTDIASKSKPIEEVEVTSTYTDDDVIMSFDKKDYNKLVELLNKNNIKFKEII